MAGSYDQITHSLRKDKGRGGVSIPLQAHTTRSRTCCGRTKAEVGSASHGRLMRPDHAQAVKGQRPRWCKHPMASSYNEITHKLWKDKGRGGVSIPWQAHTTRPRTSCGRTKAEVGSASHGRLIQPDHAQAVEGQRPRWGQHPMAGSYDEITHKLWKDKGRGGVSIMQPYGTKSRTNCRKTHVNVRSL
jgi:hypothetical protein